MNIPRQVPPGHRYKPVWKKDAEGDWELFIDNVSYARIMPRFTGANGQHYRTLQEAQDSLVKEALKNWVPELPEA